MKKSLIKNNLKTISRTKRRFISILIMAFLGVGFYSGIAATSPDMLNSLDKYADSTNLFDINIVSTLGLTNEDVEAIKKVEGIENAYGVQTKASMVKLNNKESVCKLIEYNENINLPVLIKGKLPQNSNECLLDERYSIEGNIEDYIGKTILIDNNEKNTDDTPIFTQKELKIVGIVSSPLYISTERGNASIGNGNISFYIYVKEDVINIDYFTEIYAIVNGADKFVTNSDEYLDFVNPVVNRIENIKEERQEARYNQLVNDANKKLSDAQKEYDDKKSEVEKEIADAEKKINDAKDEITNSENELQKSENQLESQKSNADKQFKEAEEKIKSAEEQISTKTTELENGKKDLENSKKESNVAIMQLNEGIQSATTSLQVLQDQKSNMQQNGLDTAEIDKKINEVQITLQGLQVQKNQIEGKIIEAEEKINSGETELNNAKKQLETQKISLETNKKTTYNKIESAKKEIASGKEKIENAKSEIKEKEKNLEDAKKEANEKLEEAQQKLNDAKDEINQIEKAKWYVQDRLDNTGYVNILDAIKTMSNLSKIFPVIFYIVAVLISLTSMTRMIEEERIEIGTLKSLGYTNLQIISKYVFYSFLACIIGGFIGMMVGFYMIPSIVWSMYSTIYTISKFYITTQFDIGLIGIVLAIICICGATIVVAYRELKEMPAILMRPKAPKTGKRILLERINFIWNKFKFSQKVTIRNIFRYKKRAIMTIVGIAGCTGLMLTGFGIKDSIIDIPAAQYGDIFKYDTTVTLADADKLENLKQYMDSNENIENYVEVYATTGKVKNEKLNYDVTIFIPDKIEEFDKVCNLSDYKTNERIKLSDNGIIITDKVADFLNVKEGDILTVENSDNIEYTLKIELIAKNYVGHNIYMSKNFYESNIKSYKTNMLMVNLKEIGEDTKNSISEEILNIEGVASISIVSNVLESIKDMLKTIDYVVIVLIVASAMLAFVVLYNLANINIGERQREIATLKVLGFYNKEVDNYINKENMIFTIVGVMLGLLFGTFLTHAVIASIEIDKLRFIIKISPYSYMISAVVTILFSLIVNRIIHFILKKIDMIESLKSIE